jgi:hypothetical protein
MLNRATAVKDISTLVSCCDWLTEPGESNYELCKQAQMVFSKGLDLVLNATEESFDIPDSRSAGSTATRNTQPDNMTESDPFALFAQDPEWKAWLESLGLQADTWLDSSSQSNESYYY